ncbi:MAG: GAF domain-containing protein [Aggregatilineales bacterium]
MNVIRRWTRRIHANYPNPLDRGSALALMWINLGAGAVWLLSTVFYLAPRFIAGADRSLLSALAIVGTPFAAYAIHALTLNNRLEWAQRLAIAGLLVATLGPLVINQGQNNVEIQLGLLHMVVVPVVAAGVMRPRAELLLVALLVTAGAVLGTLSSSLIGRVQPDFLTLEGGLAEAIASIWLVALLSSTLKGHEGSVVTGALRASGQTALLGELSDRLNTAKDENAVLVAVAETITDKMLYAACHFYLFDGQNRLNRHVRTGMGTRHAVSPARFEGERENAIGQALQARETVVVSATEPLARRSHLLASARYGAAVPLVAGERVLGALDVQSSQADPPPFEGLSLALLELTARMAAGALARVREAALLQRTLAEQEDALVGLRAEVGQLRQRILAAGGDWTSYIQGRGQGALGFDLRRENMTITPAADLPDTLRPALARGEPVVLAQGNVQVVNVPIRLRDEVLGAMAFTLPPGRQATERQMDTVRAVAERLALALENVRLIEQSQAQATRERRASEVSNLLIGQQDVNAVLKLAAERFNEALGAVYTHIYLEPAASPAPDEEAAR